MWRKQALALNELYRLIGSIKKATNLEECALNEDCEGCICIFSLESTSLSSLSWQSAWVSETTALQPRQ